MPIRRADKDVSRAGCYTARMTLLTCSALAIKQNERHTYTKLD